VQANHRLYTDYPERILATVDTCLPIEKIMPFDGMVCRLTTAELQANVSVRRLPQFAVLDAGIFD
jgi:hypothetical protein